MSDYSAGGPPSAGPPGAGGGAGAAGPPNQAGGGGAGGAGQAVGATGPGGIRKDAFADAVQRARQVRGPREARDAAGACAGEGMRRAEWPGPTRPSASWLSSSHVSASGLRLHRGWVAGVALPSLRGERERFERGGKKIVVVFQADQA